LAASHASLDGRSLRSHLLAANETDQIAQGGRRQHGDRAVIDSMLVIRVLDRQIGPPLGMDSITPSWSRTSTHGSSSRQKTRQTRPR
jgi:hypothetical protein